MSCSPARFFRQAANSTGDFLVLAFSKQPGTLLPHHAMDAFVD
jgi:hypothetical protein